QKRYRSNAVAKVPARIVLPIQRNLHLREAERRIRQVAAPAMPVLGTVRHTGCAGAAACTRHSHHARGTIPGCGDAPHSLASSHVLSTTVAVCIVSRYC